MIDTATGDLFASRPGLPETSEPYRGRRQKRRREPADCIGLEGLPDTRGELNGLLSAACERLRSAAGGFLTGRKLVEELHLRNTRALRLLVAYGRVQHRIRQIVALPGIGYVWGDARPAAYAEAASCARQMGLCHLFLASLFSRTPAQVEFAQMALEFTGQAAPPRGADDELAAWMGAERVEPAAVLEALVERFAGTAEGRLALQGVARRHADVLMPADVAAEIEADLTRSLSRLRQARLSQPESAPVLTPQKTPRNSGDARPLQVSSRPAQFLRNPALIPP